MSGDTNQPVTPPPGESLPAADRAPAPVWLIILLALLLYAGMVNLDLHGGGFSEQVYLPYNSAEDVANAWPVDPAQKQKLDGKKVFRMNCEVCHQSTGLGSAATGCPPLAGSDWVNAAGPNRIIRIVLNGLTGPLDVSGSHYGTEGKLMIPFRGGDEKGTGGLSDQQVADVLTYIRSDWGNKAGPVNPDQVKAIREKTKNQAGAWAPSALLQLPDKD